MATSYKRLEDGTYEVSTDKGPYTIRPELVGIHVLVSNLQRYSSRGKRFLGEAEDFTQSIRGRWKPGHYHFEVISEEGESKVNFPISIEIKSGDPTMSKLVHWGKTDSDSGFIISVELKKEDFDWLWCEIQSRPSARVILQIDVMPFLSGIESHMWYESSYNAIRLERNKPIKIMNTRRRGQND